MKNKVNWPLQEDILTPDDLDILVDFIKTTKRFTQFTNVKEFEQEWSNWQGCKYSVYVNSGSSANLVLLSTMKELNGWNEFDEIIVPAVTWVTNISPIMQLGLEPVFVDVNLEDLSFNYEAIEKAINYRTKAIFITHLIGFPANIDKLKKIIGGRDIAILEDCCESHGAIVNNIKVGNLSRVSSFSFYWGHHISTIEGGMICTDNEEIYNLCVLKRSHGLSRELSPELHKYFSDKYKNINPSFLFLTDGFNVRNTELHAVLGKSQLKKLDSYIAIRNKNWHKFIEICKQYSKYLHIFNIEGISSFCLPFLFFDANLKEEFELLLQSKGIETRPIISGNLTIQPFLKDYSNRRYKNAMLIHNNGFYIGNNQFVDENRLNILEDIMQEFLKENKNESRIYTI